MRFCQRSSFPVIFSDIGEEDSDQQLLTPSEIKSLEAFRQTQNSSKLETFKQLVQSNQWLTREEAVMVMNGILLRLCARYLYLEKRRGLAFNPVGECVVGRGRSGGLVITMCYFVGHDAKMWCDNVCVCERERERER